MLLLSRNTISANPEQYFFNVSREAGPRSPPEHLKDFFSKPRGFKIFSGIDCPPPPPPRNKNPR